MDSTIQLPVIKVRDLSGRVSDDLIPVEEPLEIRLAYFAGNSGKLQNLAVTMRTPGNDVELAAGFIFTEGIIKRYSDIEKIEYVFGDCSENKHNIIQVTLENNVVPGLSNTQRNFYTTSSCGVCGKTSINAIRAVSSFRPQSSIHQIDPDFLISLPDKLLHHQKIFADTGGLHACALFDMNGNMLITREDVGRHNALDKLIGASLLEDKIPLRNSVLLLSGRASFELIQKAAMAGIEIVAAIGAPSSLAVSLATEFGISLVGFLRDNRFNIYSGDHRIKIKRNENSY